MRRLNDQKTSEIPGFLIDLEPTGSARTVINNSCKDTPQTTAVAIDFSRNTRRENVVTSAFPAEHVIAVF